MSQILLYTQMVRTRREFLQSGFGGLVAVRGWEMTTGPTLKTVAVWDLPSVSLKGWQATVRELTLPPGPSPKHSHPGFVLGYVLDGDFRFQLQGQAEETLCAGQAFYEPPGAIHILSSSASAVTPTRVLALSFAEKGKALTKLL